MKTEILLSTLQEATRALVSKERRIQLLKSEVEQLESTLWEERRSIKEQTEAVRTAQEKEWKPTKDWPKGTEFYIHNVNGLVWTSCDYGDWDFSWRKAEKRWKTEKAAQLHLSAALKVCPTATLTAIPIEGNNETVPHRPVHTV